MKIKVSTAEFAAISVLLTIFWFALICDAVTKVVP